MGFGRSLDTGFRKFTSFIHRIAKSLRHRRVSAVSHLLTGTTATVGLSLVSIAMAARTLGPAQYGVLALILTLGQACERLMSFQSWQPLIKYGATLDPVSERDDLRSLFKFGLLLDLGGSAAAWATASLLTVCAHALFGMTWANVAIAQSFMLSLLFNLNGTSTAIYRMSDQFRMIARIQVLTAMLRCVLSVAAYFAGWGLLGFATIWSATQIFGSLVNIGVGMTLLRKSGITAIARARIGNVSARFPGLWGFTWGANCSLTIWASAQQVDTLIVGWLADPASAGLYHIAKRISRVVQQVGSQVESVIYPDLSRLWAKGERGSFVRLILQTEGILMAFGGACFLSAWVMGEWALRLTAGPKFAAAAPLLTVQILAVSLTISGAASRAALLAMGDQRAILRIVLAASVTFYCLVAPLVTRMGAMGANFANTLFGIVWLGGLTLAVRHRLRDGSGAPGAAVTDA